MRYLLIYRVVAGGSGGAEYGKEPVGRLEVL
ncbi:hypothetical protein Thi970DRAFT_03300, partial [Thiorhodovibrio frisius]